MLSAKKILASRVFQFIKMVEARGMRRCADTIQGGILRFYRYSSHTKVFLQNCLLLMSNFAIIFLLSRDLPYGRLYD